MPVSKNIVGLLMVFLCLAALPGCKKNGPIEITINGTVKDAQTGSILSGATVRLSVKEVVNGTFSNSYHHIETQTTGSGGSFSFTFENRNASDYKIEVTKDLYFEYTTSINPEALSTSQANAHHARIYPKAWYSINIVNSNPYDAADEILYQNLNTGDFTGCTSCCTNDQVTYIGETVNETLDCNVYGESWLRFQWVVTKATIPVLYQDSVFCTSFDTTAYTLLY